MLNNTMIEQQEIVAEAILTRLAAEAAEADIQLIVDQLPEIFPNHATLVTDFLCAIFNFTHYDQLIEWLAHEVLDEADLPEPLLQ